jgi:Fur family peroxide stress response transcriptional regulator
MTDRRKTNQRQWVFDTIKDCGHLSAQKTYEQIRVNHPEISIATVYRNLNILLETGLIKVVGNSSQLEIYDARTDLHAHFICRQCGSIIDVEDDFDARLIKSLEKAGHQVQESRLTLFGICANCRKCEVYR